MPAARSRDASRNADGAMREQLPDSGCGSPGCCLVGKLSDQINTAIARERGVEWCP